MRARATAAWAVLALAVALPAWAQEVPVPPPDPDVARIRVEFEYGKYPEALAHAQARIDRGGTSDEDLAELHKYAGLAAFNLGQSKEAERHLIALLRLDPDYSLDPFIFPPPAIQFFERLRQQHAAELEGVRQQRRAEAERRRRVEAERERERAEIAEDRRRLEELSRKVTVRVIERRSFLVNFVPFGAGQFQEGRTTLGIVLAAGEGALAAASVIGYVAHDSLVTKQTITLDDRQTPDGSKYSFDVYGIPASRAGEAQLWRLVKVIASAGFYALYGYGVIDALFHYQEEIVSTRIEDSTAPASAPSRPGLNLSHRLLPRDEGITPFFFPLPGGAGAGIRLTF